MTNAKKATGTFWRLMRRRGVVLGLVAVGLIVAGLGAEKTFATTSSITMTLSGNPTISLPPTAEGKFADSGNKTITITTDHAAGYTLALTATGTSNPTGLKNGDGTVGFVSLGTLDGEDENVCPSGINAATFDTAACNGYWGYRPSKYNSTDNTTNKYYYASPTNQGDILDETSDATDGSYTVSIGARADISTSMGSYSNTFVFTVMANPTPYAITYVSNGTPSSGMPAQQTGEDSGDQITLSTSEPIRTGFWFRGWCSDSVVDDGSCSGTTYLPGATYELNQTIDNTVTLYAIWTTDTCYGETELYNLVECQVKRSSVGGERTQTLANMQEAITEPTTANPYLDSSNSGVYKYDATTFGTASDAANTSEIYYFRGILDRSYAATDAPNGVAGTGVPSTGDSAYYQNYVRLHDVNSNKADTCWRIVRTTGSGGTKMIYNGTWTGTTCANQGGNAQAGSTYFNRGTPNTDTNHYGNQGFIAYVGYNYNSDYTYNNTGNTSLLENTTLFKNTNALGTQTASNIKTQIETWYNNTSNLANYNTNHKLETSAGWCNDRTTTDAPSLSDKTIPYAPSGNTVLFGARRRNVTANAKATLECKNTTGQDLLTTDNGFLGAPLAPLTEDEVVFAGHGFPTGSSPYNPDAASSYSSRWSYRSFLRSGSNFWLLSPNYRNSDGYVSVFLVNSVGFSGSYDAYYSNGLRPAISIASGTTVTGGAGTSQNPWVVEP